MERQFTYAPPTVKMGKECFSSRDCTTLWWTSGGGFMLNSHGTIVFVDPVISTMPEDSSLAENGAPLAVTYPISPEEIVAADAILYTHSDMDHLGRQTAPRLEHLHARSYGPPPCYKVLMELGYSWKDVEMCRPDDVYTVGSVTIEVMDADHPHQYYEYFLYGHLEEKVFRPGDCVGYKITTPDGTFFFPGDTRLMEYHLKLKGIDVLALDVSDCSYHLGFSGSVVMANAVDARYLLPYHYGSYKFENPETSPGFIGGPNEVLERVRNGKERARILGPGEPFSIKNGVQI